MSPFTSHGLNEGLEFWKPQASAGNPLHLKSMSKLKGDVYFARAHQVGHILCIRGNLYQFF